jgi:CheY-like chemotaxis protein
MPHGGFFSVDSLRGVWILVVDRHPLERQSLVQLLTYCGALVTPLSSPDDALGVMRQVKPDVLVVSLTEEPDFEFIRRVRSLKPEEGGVVPAIAITRGENDETVRARGFQASVRAPLDPWDLCRLVSTLMTVP